MAFEVYDKIGQSHGFVNATGVRLAKDGIHFTLKFAEDNCLNTYKYIVFYYDRDSNRMGFEFQNTFIRGRTYKLTKVKTHATTYKCGANSFLRHYNIRPTKSRRYEPIENDGMFIIQLQE